MRISCRSLLLAALLGLTTTGCLQAGDNTPPPLATLTDGPYVIRDGQRLRGLWVCNGKPTQRDAYPRHDGIAKLPVVCGYPHPLPILPPVPEAADHLPMPTRLAAVSDIHGQFGVLRRLLRANRIIDAQDHWNYGDGSLVVAGDVFDRGPQVTEALWLLYTLQQQAKAAGGAVHFVLGNHETMTLYDSLRYLNPKYEQVAALLEQTYPALYAGNTVLGQWLRTRPVLLRLGNTLFLHGGISPQDLDLVVHQQQTNANYRRSLGTPKKELMQDPVLARLYDGKTSPIWYRGYFNGELKTPDVEALVTRLGLERIVVGHTTMGEVASFHDGRVIAIDSAIKRGKAGQVLFIEDGVLSRGLMDGSRQPLPALHEIPRDDD